MKKNLRLPMFFEKVEGNILNDDTLVPARVKVMHSDLNLNGSKFGELAITNAENTLKNKPILAYVRKVDGEENLDFAGHEVELQLSSDGIKEVFLERPIGVIPESNNYELVEEDGKLWVYCDAYLWADYMNSAYDIFQENNIKSVSMEIEVDDFAMDGEVFDITSYRYKGVTVLGDSVNPAMQNAEIVVQFSAEEVDTELAKRISELNLKIDKFNAIEEPKVEPIVEEPSQVFELTYREKRELLDKAIAMDNADKYTWLMDFSNDYIIYEVEEDTVDSYVYNYYKQSYSITESIVNLDNDRVEVFSKWLTQTEIDAVNNERDNAEQIFQALKDEKEVLDGKIVELEANVSDYEKSLNEYHAKERKEEENELFSNFDVQLAENVDYIALKDDASKYELDELESKCYIILGKVNAKFSKKPKAKKQLVTRKIVVEDNESIVANPYEGLNFNVK